MEIDNGFLRGDAKQGVKEGTLTDYIAVRQSADLPFADHVHRLLPVLGEIATFRANLAIRQAHVSWQTRISSSDPV